MPSASLGFDKLFPAVFSGTVTTTPVAIWPDGDYTTVNVAPGGAVVCIGRSTMANGDNLAVNPVTALARAY